MGDFSNEFTTISYLIDAANSGKSMIRVLSENTDVFVLLVRWVYGEEMECKVQMEQWDMTVLGHSVCSSMAYTTHPQQLRHDLIFIRQSQDQWLSTLLTNDFPG